MTNHLLLDWAITAVSLFNTVLFTWLGLTVLLNSDRRTWGIWLAGSGLLLGSAFFFIHSALLAVGITNTARTTALWIAIGMIPAVILPFAWYVTILWYTGYWEPNSTRFRQRQRPRLWLLFAFLGLGFIALILLAIPYIPLTYQLRTAVVPIRELIKAPIGRIPLVVLAYPAYVLFCVLFALDALWRPGVSRRAMGELARNRARPWLIFTTILLLLVSILVAWIVFWAVNNIKVGIYFIMSPDALLVIGRIDLLISLLMSAVIVLMGQAVVSYELFTGKTLPRKGLQRHWRRAVLLAAGYGIGVGATIAFDVAGIFGLLLTTFLMTFFFALSSWRSYAERERTMAGLRPFYTSQRLTDQLLTQAPPTLDLQRPFHALCADVLHAETAVLTAVGPFAPLIGPPLVYPSQRTPLVPALDKLTGAFHSPDQMVVGLDAADYGGAIWAVSLWSERGLSGILLLGPKQGGGLYAQEEIETARVIGERLIDSHASAEMARRLLAIQRQRLTQTQIIDQQTRRVLHDEILPNLHAAMIALSQDEAANQEALALLSDSHRQISDLLHNMPTITTPDVARLGLLKALQRLVTAEYSTAFDQITWQIDDAAADNMAQLPTLTAEVLYFAAREAIRNAAKYGRDPESQKPFNLAICARLEEGLVLEVEDNGCGLGFDKLNQPEGSGQGLALHSTMMIVIGGQLIVDGRAGQFTRVTLLLDP